MQTAARKGATVAKAQGKLSPVRNSLRRCVHGAFACGS
jgi:hypothetical protein